MKRSGLSPRMLRLARHYATGFGLPGELSYSDSLSQLQVSLNKRAARQARTSHGLSRRDGMRP